MLSLLVLVGKYIYCLCSVVLHITPLRLVFRDTTAYFQICLRFSRMSRGLKRKPMALIKRLRKAKKEAPTGEKPKGIKTHLRDMLIVPEMIGSIVGIYNGKMFCGVEMKPEMVGMYLGEFAITYKPVRHGRPGVSAAHATRFIPL